MGYILSTSAFWGDLSGLTFVIDPAIDFNQYCSWPESHFIETKGKNSFGENEVDHRKVGIMFPQMERVSGSLVETNPEFLNAYNHRNPFYLSSGRYLTAVGKANFSYRICSEVSVYDRTIYSDGSRVCSYHEKMSPLVDPSEYVERSIYEFDYLFNFEETHYTFHQTWYDSDGSISFDSIEELPMSKVYFKTRTLLSYHLDTVTAYRLWAQQKNRALSSLDTDNHWGRLLGKAAERMSLIDVNLLLFAKEAPELVAIGKSFRELLKNPKSIKSWASAYLSYEYGVRSTVRETSLILKRMKKKAMRYPKARNTRSGATWQVQHSGFVEVYSRHVKMWYENIDALYTVFNRFEDTMGISSPAQAIWDSIPLSFVANWFTNLSEVIDGLEARDRLARSNTLGYLRSQLAASVGPIQKYIEDGPNNAYLSLSIYNREWKDKVETPTFASLEFNSLSKSNLVKGGALVVQRLR